MNRYDAARVGLFVGAILAAFVVGHYIQVNYLETPWMVGGYDCEPSMVDGEEYMACFGYPPTGVAFLALGFAFAVSPLIVAVNKLERRD